MMMIAITIAVIIMIIIIITIIIVVITINLGWGSTELPGAEASTSALGGLTSQHDLRTERLDDIIS